MNKSIAVLGVQWGDEGKGKVVDFLCDNIDIVVRFQGGHNAGHTLIIGDKKIVLRLLPSGIMHPHVCALIGNGTVVSLDDLMQEVAELETLGVEVSERIKLSANCALLLPYHKQIDCARESALAQNMIGTTGRGIGPAYEDKIARNGLRLADLYHYDQVKSELERIAEYHNFILTHYYQQQPIDPAKVLDVLCQHWQRIEPWVVDGVQWLHQQSTQDKKILFEGAQGSLLDIDHGTYPYVTSSNTTAGNIACGSGMPPNSLIAVHGVVKAYTTRVGSGPFPTEIEGEVGAWLVKQGGEVGSNTGRTRRCGWFDMVLLRYVALINGLTHLCLTKIDVLDGLSEIKLCVAYELDGKQLDAPPKNKRDLERCQPIYETVAGWNERTQGVKDFAQLPAAARAYVKRLSDGVGLPVKLISTGPKRADTIIDPDITRV